MNFNASLYNLFKQPPIFYNFHMFTVLLLHNLIIPFLSNQIHFQRFINSVTPVFFFAPYAIYSWGMNHKCKLTLLNVIFTSSARKFKPEDMLWMKTKLPLPQNWNLLIYQAKLQKLLLSRMTAVGYVQEKNYRSKKVYTTVLETAATPF